jgi:hypothetical protein
MRDGNAAAAEVSAGVQARVETRPERRRRRDFDRTFAGRKIRAESRSGGKRQRDRRDGEKSLFHLEPPTSLTRYFIAVL